MWFLPANSDLSQEKNTMPLNALKRSGAKLLYGYLFNRAPACVIAGFADIPAPLPFLLREFSKKFEKGLDK